MKLSDRELIIRDWQPNDVDPLVSAANNRNVATWLRDRFPHPYTHTHAVQFIDYCQQQESPSHFAILYKEKVVGGIGLELGSDVERFNAELGYWLAEAVWGQGLMSRCLNLFVPWCAQYFDLHRIFALPMTQNTGSARVLEKAGFQKEGTLRQSCFKNGNWHDQFLYARIFP